MSHDRFQPPLVCVLVMCLYYWSLGAADTQFTEKQAYYEKIGKISFIGCLCCLYHTVLVVITV